MKSLASGHACTFRVDTFHINQCGTSNFQEQHFGLGNMILTRGLPS
ncbi:hypothetical protein BIW11_09737 [Tropilaelaps mercedesae]|uniref:Uncharacterized protein n=1 Tax=Tropilaelaps mercedesae TaxID=418985 RepID=A0A1V9XJ13_9ACAR|nr:hypothetical protein BIW11_09737 [Tropilaelaps mercedesae]